MIAQLTGAIARLEANGVILDVNGVGYRVSVPLSTLSNLPAVGEKTTLYTTMNVSANTMEFSLYGFPTLEEQQIFGVLISVTGVGPRVALAILSVMEVADLARAMASSDIKSLTKVPGLGQKLAQRLCLELGERMAQYMFVQRIEGAEQGRDTPQEDAAYSDVIEALVNLGYSRLDSRKAAERAFANAADKTSTPSMIREALNLLSSGGRR